MEKIRIIKADLHNHLRTNTRANFQEGDFNKAIDIAERRLGKGGVFGLINFDDSNYEAFSRLRGYEREELDSGFYVPGKEIVVVKGQEVQTKQGHLLVLGLRKDKHLKSGRNVELEDALKEARDEQGIIGLGHPFYLEGLGKYVQAHPKLLDDLYFIEIFNGEAIGNANEKARRFFRDMHKDDYIIAGLCASDGHSFYELGKNYTFIREVYRKNLVRSLRQRIIEAPILGYQSHISVLGAINHLVDLSVIGISKLRKS